MEKRIRILAEAVRQMQEDRLSNLEALAQRIRLLQDQVNEIMRRISHLGDYLTEAVRKIDTQETARRNITYSLENHGRALASTGKRIEAMEPVIASVSREIVMMRSLSDESFTVPPELEAAQKGFAMEELLRDLETEDPTGGEGMEAEDTKRGTKEIPKTDRNAAKKKEGKPS